MLRIRLKRMGMKKKPFYRIVVADALSPRDSRPVEEIGWYNPLVTENQVSVNVEKAKDWIAKGAQPSDTVRALLKKNGVEMK